MRLSIAPSWGALTSGDLQLTFARVAQIGFLILRKSVKAYGSQINTGQEISW